MKYSFCWRCRRGSDLALDGCTLGTVWAPLGSLTHAVQTGENAFEHALGMTFFEYLSRNAEVGSFFNQTMVKNAPARYTGLSSVYDFSKVRTVVDLGGGEGGLLLHLLREQEHLGEVLLDLPDVVANAPVRFEAAGFINRCKIVAGGPGRQRRLHPESFSEESTHALSPPCSPLSPLCDRWLPVNRARTLHVLRQLRDQ
jgi:hypothetical protein